MGKQFDFVNDAFLWAWKFSLAYIKKEIINSEESPRYGITDFERDMFIKHTYHFLLSNNFKIKGVLKSEFGELQKKYPDCSDKEIFFNLMYRLEISRILYDAMNIVLEKGQSFVTIDEIIQALICRQKLDFANMPFNEFLDNMRKEILASTYYHFNMNDDDKKSYTS